MENYFEKNIGLFGLKGLQSSWKTDRFTLESENYIGEINEPSNRVLYIGIEMTSLYDINEKLLSLNEKSMLFLFYRETEYLSELLTKFDFTSYEDKVLFFAGDISSSETIVHLNQSIVRIMFSYTILKPIVKETLDMEYVKLATEVIRHFREYRDNYEFMLGNNTDDTLYGLKNRMLNTPNYAKNMGYLELLKVASEQYKGKPAIMVASGPSLDKNVHLLKDYQDKALILACDGSLSTLFKHGITPQVVGSVERIKKTYEVFYGNREEELRNMDIIFSGPAVVRPEIVDIFKNQKMISVFKAHESYGIWMDDITMNKKGKLWSGTSVAHFLYSFAEGLGCDPIILIGQDLAYSTSGLSHAGDVEVIENIDLNKVETWVTDYEGKDIPSTSVWKMFLLTLEEMVRSSPSKAIDATEGGALIKGTEIMSLQDALEGYCKDTLPRISDFVNEYECEPEYLEKVKGYSLNKIKTFARLGEVLLKKIEKGIDLNRKAAQRVAKGIDRQEQLDKIYDAIEFVDNEIVKYIAKEPLLMMLFQYPIFAASRHINALQSDTYTLETIKFNLELHEKMLEFMELYSKKFIYLIYEALNELSDYYSEQLSYAKFMHNYYKKHAEILEDRSYRPYYF